MVVSGCVSGKVLYISLSGEMDECSAQSARAKCDKLIDDNLGVTKIIINLSEVAFILTAALSYIVGINIGNAALDTKKPPSCLYRCVWKSPILPPIKFLI